MRTPNLVWSAAIVIVVGGIMLSTVFGLVTTRAQSSLDMDKIFRCHSDEEEAVKLCNEARDLILNHCTACHTFAPIVMQQFDEKGWNGLIDRHRPRVSHLEEEQIETIRTYLIKNFNPSKPPPKLPPALLKNWTSY